MSDTTSPQPVTLGAPTWTYAHWYTPKTPPPWPTICLLPPLAANVGHLHSLSHHLVAQDWAVLSLDFHHFGHSPGRIRNHLDLARQYADILAANHWLKQHPQVANTAIAYWGISLSAGHLLTPLIASLTCQALVLQTPFICGRSSLAANLPHLDHLKKLAQKRPYHPMRFVDPKQPTLLSGKSAWDFYQQGPHPIHTITLQTVRTLTEYSVLNNRLRHSCPPVVG